MTLQLPPAPPRLLVASSSSCCSLPSARRCCSTVLVGSFASSVSKMSCASSGLKLECWAPFSVPTMCTPPSVAFALDGCAIMASTRSAMYLWVSFWCTLRHFSRRPTQSLYSRADSASPCARTSCRAFGTSASSWWNPRWRTHMKSICSWMKRRACSGGASSERSVAACDGDMSLAGRSGSTWSTAKKRSTACISGLCAPLPPLRLRMTSVESIWTPSGNTSTGEPIKVTRTSRQYTSWCTCRHIVPMMFFMLSRHVYASDRKWLIVAAFCSGVGCASTSEPRRSMRAGMSCAAASIAMCTRMNPRSGSVPLTAK
mmetsp:Transcript_10325/g.31946  ORF Transcript_10325/g.31946 Transcript_10325/m.31946 type:complete len:315 (-) Transcript_10325:780-1724(-)